MDETYRTNDLYHAAWLYYNDRRSLITDGEGVAVPAQAPLDAKPGEVWLQFADPEMQEYHVRQLRYGPAIPDLNEFWRCYKYVKMQVNKIKRAGP